MQPIEFLESLDWNELARRYKEAEKYMADLEEALKKHPKYVSAKAEYEAIDQILMQRIASSGATSIVTPSGTIHTVGRTTARCEDPELFRGWLQETGDWSYADLRPNMTACRDSKKAGKDVPGVVLSTTRWLSISKPKTLKVNDV